MKKPFNTIIVARRNPDNEILAVGTDFQDVDDRGRKALKEGETFYIRYFAEVEEGQILCERKHCYEQHFNYCPHCGGKLKYREDDF